MLEIDDIDLINISSEYGDEKINELNYENANKIYQYLLEAGIYYAKDILISDFNLYLLDSEIFKERFEQLKQKLGNDYIEKLSAAEEDYWLDMY